MYKSTLLLSNYSMIISILTFYTPLFSIPVLINSTSTILCLTHLLYLTTLPFFFIYFIIRYILTFSTTLCSIFSIHFPIFSLFSTQLTMPLLLSNEHPYTLRTSPLFTGNQTTLVPWLSFENVHITTLYYSTLYISIHLPTISSNTHLSHHF